MNDQSAGEHSSEQVTEQEIVIATGDRLTIETTGEFAEKIRTALNGAARVVIDFDPNLTLDITALQLFCSACAQATAEGKAIIHRGASPAALLELAEAAGTERHMRCRNANRTCFRQFGGEATWQS